MILHLAIPRIQGDTIGSFLVIFSERPYPGREVNPTVDIMISDREAENLLNMWKRQHFEIKGLRNSSFDMYQIDIEVPPPALPELHNTDATSSHF
jgi:hypothetical protein